MKMKSLLISGLIIVFCFLRCGTDEKNFHQIPIKGYALLIGMNDVNDAYYGTGKDYHNALNDIKGFQRILNRTNSYTNIEVKDSLDTRWCDIVSSVQNLQNITRRNPYGSYVFILFSGHGFLENDEQFLCLRDRMVHKNEIRKLLEGFNERTKVYMVINSCHSGEYGYPVILPSDIYKKRYASFYKSVITRYSKYEFRGKASVCYTSATDKYGKAPRPVYSYEKSPFIQKYLDQWGDSYSSVGYGNFKLTTYERNDRSFFLKTYPLIFK